MKTISLSSDGTNLNADIHIEIISRSFFPNSDVDSRQWSMLWRDELNRYRQTPDNFNPSFISQAATHGIAKRQGRMAVAGLVLHCYLFLMDKDIKPSLEKASKLASEIAYTVGKARVHVKGKEQFFNLDGDQVGVKKAFREYRSIAPIAAARVAFSENYREADIYSIAPSKIIEFVSLALHLQVRAFCIPEHEKWNMIKLIDAPKSFLGEVGLFNSSTLIDLNEDIEQAYARCSL
jgi:hypothetical protein